VVTPILQSLLAPGSVAVIGASADPDKVGGRPIDYLRRFGFGGAIYPINPNRQTVQGLACYPDLAALPTRPDVAVVVVPGAAAVRAIEQCAGEGVGAAIVLASGFGESSEEGRQAQQRMTSIAREAGMRMMGPNCQGISNFSNGAVLTFSTMYLEHAPEDGPIAVISQSGSASQVQYAMLRAQGLGIRYCAATGNEADLSAIEVAAAVAHDPEVHLLLLYLETIRDGFWLAELGQIAAARNLPVVTLKAGATAAGQSAASSHTGALANEDRVVDAFLERAGIFRARDQRELLLAVELHLRRDWKPKGPGLVVMSNSGASCVQAADAIVTEGLKVAELHAGTVERIAAALPAFATPTNPIDLTGALLGTSHLLTQVLLLLGDDPAVDALVIAIPVAGQGYDVEAFAVGAAEFAAAGIPTVVVTAHPPVESVFRRRGLPVFATEVEAVAALAQWWRWSERLSAARVRPVVPAWNALEGEPETLDEAASLAVLAAAGVPVVAHELCGDQDAAVRALVGLGGPVALKGCTPRATHKSELGLVALGLRTASEVREAYSRVSAALHLVDPDAPGVLVARMATGRQLMIGARIDPVFGPIVLVGEGGAYVEVLPDVQLLLPPVAHRDVLAALGRLRIAPLLQGVRGEPPSDVGTFADMVVEVARLLCGDNDVVELDINPVLVGVAGDGCVAVDAVVMARGNRGGAPGRELHGVAGGRGPGARSAPTKWI
jgi:acyl-CoA synthetase (NDP forming)